MDRLQNKEKVNWLSFIAVFISVVFNLNTLFTTSRFTSEQYAIVSLALYVILFVLSAVKTHGIATLKNVSFLVLASILVLFTAVLNTDINILYLVIILELFKATLLLSIVSYKELVRYYIIAIYSLAIYSIIMHSLCTFVPGFSSIGKAIYNSNGHAFRDFIFYYRDSTESFRNFGFLSEPGDYQHYLNVGLILCLFFDNGFNEKLKNRIVVILTLTVITTFSPAGILFLICIWIAYLLDNTNNPVKILSFVALAVIFIFAIMQIDQVNDGVNYALNKLNARDSGSFKVRWTGIVAGLQAFVHNPLYGMGYTNGTSIMSAYFNSNKLGYNQTSTVTGLLGFFGIPFTLCTLIPFFRFFKLPNIHSVATQIIVMAGLVLSINNERLIWELTFYIFVVFGACYGGKDDNCLSF